MDQDFCSYQEQSQEQSSLEPTMVIEMWTCLSVSSSIIIVITSSAQQKKPIIKPEGRLAPWLQIQIAFSERQRGGQEVARGDQEWLRGGQEVRG